uniref:Uncharacterized protein n=1 Tax=Arundo donax TaxID=35708 RepID=A0A0A8YTA9_ARUDO
MMSRSPTHNNSRTVLLVVKNLYRSNKFLCNHPRVYL